MFPPIEDAVLQNNPKFAALHKTLTIRILNPDGSSKSPATADREATTEAIHTHRLRAAKSDLIRSALASLPLNDQNPALPPELLELIILLSLKLSTPNLSSTSLALLTTSEPYCTLDEHLPRISALLSIHLHKQALSLTRVLHPRTNPSYLHRTIPKIPSAIHTLHSTIAHQKTTLDTARLSLISLTVRVLDHYRTAFSLAIQILEQHKHGQLARSVRAKAELLSVEAQREELNAQVLYLTARNAIYTPEVRSALRNYGEHLRDAGTRLGQRLRDGERELERYGVGREGKDGKERLMREIARVYGELGREIEEVKMDMERLKGA